MGVRIYLTHWSEMECSKLLHIATLFLCYCMAACASQPKPVDFNTNSSRLLPEPDLIERLVNQKKLWDDLHDYKTFYRLYSTPILLDVTDSTLLPDNIKSVYTIYKDSMGNIKKIIIAPFDIDRHSLANNTHYFDNEGQTFAFENHTADFFGSTTTIAFYNKSFAIIALEKSTYSVLNDSTSYEKFDMKDFNYKVASDFENYQKMEDFKFRQSR